MKKKLHGLKIILNTSDITAQDILHVQPFFVALSVNAVSVLKSCLTLVGLGDKGCHLIESRLQ